ncbi:MAG: hypothetical protein ACM3VT_15880 [Solirubrobacterales bacterium]
MQTGNQLGIYLRKDRAAVVCLASQSRDRKPLECFSVAIDGEDVNPRVLCDRIAFACGERKTRFAEAAVALDCADFMQHGVHSEFTDPKKIAATVRFDTEETLAADISDVAVTFRVASTDEEGANLDVFTAQRAVLTETIQSLQVNDIDPVAIDPDVYCLSRYLIEHAKGARESEGSTLYAVLSDCRGYLVVVSTERKLVTLRTFLIGPAQDRTALLSREAIVTMALAAAHPVKRLCACDVRGELNLQSIAEKMGIAISVCDLAAMAGVEPESLSACSNVVDFALACGAALGLAEKSTSVNFRNDHMPFLGKKMRMQRAVRFLSISMTVLFLAIGVFVHSMLLRENRYQDFLRAKLEPDYLLVMRGKTKLPDSMKTAVGDLQRALRVLTAEKTGAGADQESVSAKMTLILTAVNKCAKKTDLKIEKVTISGPNITVNGSAASQVKATEVLDTMTKEGLELGSHSISGNGEFSATLVVKKQTQKG